MEGIEQVGPWIERLGVATVLLLIGIGFAWKVLSWLGKRVDKWFDAQLDLMDTLQKSDGKHLETLATLTSQGQNGHAKTHSKLDEVHQDVKHIKERFQPKGQ